MLVVNARQCHRHGVAMIFCKSEAGSGLDFMSEKDQVSSYPFHYLQSNHWLEMEQVRLELKPKGSLAQMERRHQANMARSGE